MVDGAIFVKDHDPALIRKIVEGLQAQSWVGPVFTPGKKGATGYEGTVKGTLSFDVIHWDISTVLMLRHIPVPAAMDGRVMDEFMVGTGSKAPPVAKKRPCGWLHRLAGGVMNWKHRWCG